MNINLRPKKTFYYLNIAHVVSERATCLRRKWGAVIVKNDIIVSTGYNGAPRDATNCCDVGFCKREKLNIPSGERYELCVAVHAEQNAMIQASHEDMDGATMYISGTDLTTGKIVENFKPCLLCQRMIINAGIEKVIIRNGECGFDVYMVEEFIERN